MKSNTYSKIKGVSFYRIQDDFSREPALKNTSLATSQSLTFQSTQVKEIRLSITSIPKDIYMRTFTALSPIPQCSETSDEWIARKTLVSLHTFPPTLVLSRPPQHYGCIIFDTAKHEGNYFIALRIYPTRVVLCSYPYVTVRYFNLRAQYVPGLGQ